jgi:predicted transcriptional regulator
MKAADDAKGGALKTYILYRANLGHRQLHKYLTFLEERDLIREVVNPDTGRRVYEVTEKGADFLKEFKRVTQYFIEK